MKKNKLFLICPFSNLENFIRRIYYTDVYFITAMATDFNFEPEYIGKISEFIDRRMITEMYVVNDISCRFMKGIIHEKCHSGTVAEKKLERLFMENHLLIMNQPSINEKLEKFAELNVKKQISNISENACIKTKIKKGRVRIKGMITNRSDNKFIVLDNIQNEF